MQWPWSGHKDEKRKTSLVEDFKTTDWRSAFTDPRILGPSLILAAGAVVTLRFYKSYLRRIPTVNHIKPDYFRRRTLFGQVTTVGDADNFRLFHTPGGRIAGWDLLPWKRVPSTKEKLLKQTIHIRIAGVDAPELAHFGREAQPYSKEALQWLTAYIHNRRVRAYIFRRDQYDRAVAQIYVRKWLIRRDVGLEMLRNGFATVYEAKSGSEFGKFEQKYRDAEVKARQQKVGMWTGRGVMDRLRGTAEKTPESPREYKTRHAAADKQKKVKLTA